MTHSKNPTRLAASTLALLCLAAGCTSPAAPQGQQTSAPTTTVPAPTLNAATTHACTAFFGDPDYSAPGVDGVLAAGASALEIGGTNQMLFDQAAEDVRTTFAQSSPGVRAAADGVVTWLATEPAKGKDANVSALKKDLEDLATQCAPASTGATWMSPTAAKKDGTKPAALVCADIAARPQLLTHFGNGNVMTSNMFRLVGLSPRTVKKKDMEAVSATLELLRAERKAVDDPGVAKALDGIAKPFADAEAGERNSAGLRAPLAEFGAACDAAGYGGAVDVPSDEQDDTHEGGLAGE